MLTGSAVAMLTACTRTSRRPAAAPPVVDPDVALRAAAVAREQALLDAYDAAATTPALQARLSPLRAEHAVHLQALGGGPAVAGPAPPTSPTVAQLAALERVTAAAHRDAAVTASRRLAPVLASLAASETTHLSLL